MRERTDNECGLCDCILYSLPNIFVFIGCITAIAWNALNSTYDLASERDYRGYDSEHVAPNHFDLTDEADIRKLAETGLIMQANQSAELVVDDDQ